MLAGASGLGATYATTYDIFFVVDGDGIIRFRGRNGIWNASAIKPVVDQALLDLLVPVDDLPQRDGFRLAVPYPNPFNPTTRIPYRLDGFGEEVDVKLQIVDLRGREIRSLVSARQITGNDYTAIWDGRGNSGQAVPSGTYLVNLTVSGKSQSRFITMVK